MKKETPALDTLLKMSSPKGEPVAVVDNNDIVKLYVITAVTCQACQKTFGRTDGKGGLLPTGAETEEEIKIMMKNLHAANSRANGILCLHGKLIAPVSIMFMDVSLAKGE